jgi:hypothetical protein
LLVVCLGPAATKQDDTCGLLGVHCETVVLQHAARLGMRDG